MNEKIDHQKIQSYSLEYAEQLMDRFFKDGSTYISGNELLTFSEVKQVNFFILKALFSSWKNEVARLKSPYFDYEHEESKKAINEFMNVLSRHIKVKRRDLLPITISAVQETIYLLVSPFEFFYADFSQIEGENIDASHLEKELKYTKINKGLISNLIGKIKEEFGGVAPKESVITLLEGLLTEKELIEDPEDQINLFSEVLPLKTNELVLEDVPNIPEVADAPVSPPQEEDELSNIPTDLADPVPTESIAVQDPIENETPAIEEPQIPSDLESLEEDLDIQPLDQQDDTNETAPKSLNDQFSAPDKVLNDKLKSEDVEPLAEILDKQSNHDTILNTMSINHGYLFINELFNGNADEFNLAMERVETCKNFDGAVELLVQKYARPFNWDMNSKEVKELLKVVFRRFR